MDFEVMFEGMDEEEKDAFFQMDTMGYYRYVKEMPVFQTIQGKLDTSEKLTEEEWHFVIMKLFFVFCHALMRQEKIDIISQIILLFAKINMKLATKNGPLYNECYKVIEFVTSYQKECEVNKDLLKGIQTVVHSHDETDLGYLLRQYQEASLFHDSRRAYLDEYHHTTTGELSPNEKLYIHAFHNAYQEEKKLVKQYVKDEK